MCVKYADLDDFTRAYVDCALWSECDGSDIPLDCRYSADDIDPDALSAMVADCLRFQTENATDIDGRDECAGYDFWLNRNGHGAGFWDGDWPDRAGMRLSVHSKDFGECHLYVGDDGKVYLFSG
jgi:hypothetical protein